MNNHLQSHDLPPLAYYQTQSKFGGSPVEYCIKVDFCSHTSFYR
ncbi:hypothetical protein E1A91_A05G365900v1 [Gossypium mustelinum]|uniref:Uncharacterized protein n=1 Tax=Gossypium mustelinum TaxID=34275 RepID=A0A5D2ZEQ1_GOSMU|nr:hypothetical protein E1A91_A05G365900v1 [Gossypium mustelinum]